MNKRARGIVCLLVAAVLLVGCNMDVKEEKKDSYMEYPFAKGQTLKDEAMDISSLVGTYIFSPALATSDLDWVSLLEDGTAYKMGYTTTTLSYLGELKKGTWSVQEGRLSVSVDGISYDAVAYEVIDGKGLRVKNSYGFDVFVKKANAGMDAAIYNDAAKLAGLWAKSNDYGEVDGYRFLADGTMYRYTSSGSASRKTWAMSNGKPQIRMTTLDGVDNTYKSILRCGDFLFLDGEKYSKVE